MKVLVVGSGGREHALVWKIAQSRRVERVFVAPGNAGMKDLAEIIDIKATSIIELADFAKEEGIDLTVIGAEQPLALGIVDEFSGRNLKVFGPTQKAAMIESSKSFAKELMRKNNIPTADFAVFSSSIEALSHLDRARFPLVVKTDGLAAGKGVMICQNRSEAEDAIREIMLESKFGKAGERLLIEEFLEGTEMSFQVISDGRRVIPLVTAMDYKKLQEGDQGPNTGGMGALSPAPNCTKELIHSVMRSIIKPTIDAMRFENKEFKGVLYAGLMITRDGPKVLEFNARFGDPETQVVMMRLKSDLVDLLEASADENLFDSAPEWHEHVAACVTLASRGYPGKFATGKKIQGLERSRSVGVEVFHAGTELRDGAFHTSGGRVLNVCATGVDLKEAMGKIQDGISFIAFEDMIFRQDIGRVRSGGVAGGGL